MSYLINRVFCAGFLVFALALGFAAPALAADSPEAVQKYRSTIMKTNGGHIGAIAAIVKGNVSYKNQIADHALAVSAIAKHIPEMFPEGTGPDRVKTRAKAEIWTDRRKFEAMAADLSVQAAKLAEVAKGGDMAAIGRQLGATGKACGACHRVFRGPRN